MQEWLKEILFREYNGKNCARKIFYLKREFWNRSESEFYISQVDSLFNTGYFADCLSSRSYVQMWKQYNKDWPFPWKNKQLCCSSSVWKENNLNILSRKFQFSHRYLQVVPDCWDGQQVGNASHKQLLKKSDLNWNIRHCMWGRAAGVTHMLLGQALDWFCFIVTVLFRKVWFCNSAIFKPS